MIKIAALPVPHKNAVELMLYSKKKETFVFGFKTHDDAPCSWDAYFSDLEDAYELGEDYGIMRSDWQEIADPADGCQHDRIAPIASSL